MREWLLYFFLAFSKRESKLDILGCPCFGLLELKVLFVFGL